MQAENSEKEFFWRFQIEHGEVEGDWARIQQILNNLLSNAFKFTKEDGKIRLQAEEIRDSRNNYRKYHFTVSDNGFGMSQEFLKKIFVPFERETRFGAANVAGTGLGMPIVHELVQKMEGTIQVTSELGKGSVFQVILPLQIHEGIQEGETEKETAGAVKKEEMDLTGMQVLLTEDNEINMEIAAEILEACGLKITKAWNGKEALEIYLSHEPYYFDFILMDMQGNACNGRLPGGGAHPEVRQSRCREDPYYSGDCQCFCRGYCLDEKGGNERPYFQTH